MTIYSKRMHINTMQFALKLNIEKLKQKKTHLV